MFALARLTQLALPHMRAISTGSARVVCTPR
jgi:hypothetical protein